MSSTPRPKVRAVPSGIRLSLGSQWRDLTDEQAVVLADKLVDLVENRSNQ